MAPFSVSQLKEKASNARSSGTEKFQSVREKYTGRSPAASIHSSRDLNTKVPPPPIRTSHEGSQAAGVPDTLQRTVHSAPPPPVRRNTRPVPAAISKTQYNDDGPKEPFTWSAISHEDKNLFFGWLDEFFDAKVRRSKGFEKVLENEGPRNNERIEKPQPLRSEQGSAAQDLKIFFSPATRWEVPWYSSQESIPPPLAATTDGIRTTSIQSIGDTRTISGGVLFSDLSACWYTVTWMDGNAHDTTLTRRSAAYAPKPDALSREALLIAHETYGETVAAFAEGYEGTGRWCARGECWDLASEALKLFEQWEHVPKPLPSIGRTHGHLIYEGKAWGMNSRTDQIGWWRGGDDHIRRGDIVQWKSVKIVDGNQWFTLGEPDHTAIIVRDQQPLRIPSTEGTLHPVELGSIEVVEQSVHSPPARQVYKLGGMISGEVWIYRPVGMEAYLNFSFSETCPEGL